MRGKATNRLSRRSVLIGGIATTGLACLAARAGAAKAPATVASQASPYPTTSWCGDSCPATWAERLYNRTIIDPSLDPSIGDNIDGAALIRVPKWVKNPLGRYYLYFAHHRGSYIRLAYADRIDGPWKIYKPGVLQIADSGFTGHIASPDILIDDENQRLIMYYHGVAGQSLRDQKTRVSTSADGLSYRAAGGIVMDWYARAFRHDGRVYAIAAPGIVFRADNPLGPFEHGPTILPENTRHCGLRLRGDILQIFYSNRGDNPESILLREVDLKGDWRGWTAGPSKMILAPERDYEGGNITPAPSALGPATTRVRQLRDPYVFEEDGRSFLIYAVAGEAGLAVAELHD